MAVRPGGSSEAGALDIGVSRLTSARTIVLSTGINLLGRLVPALVGFATLPFIVRGLGPEKYGLFSLLWSSISFFFVFDMGLGRAATKYISEALGRQDHGSVAEIIWSSILLQLLFGMIGGGILGAGSLLLVSHTLNIPAQYLQEARWCFLALACSVPLALVEFTLSGALQAAQRFDLVASINVPVKILTLLVLLLVAVRDLSLLVFVLIYVGFKVASILLYLRFCLRLYPGLLAPPRPRLARFAGMFHFGKWVTVSALINSLLGNVDKYYLASVANMFMVSAFAGPFQLIDRMSIFQTSLDAVIFPCLSTLGGATRNKDAQGLFMWSLKITCLAFGTLSLLLIGFSDTVVWLFLGRDYLKSSVPVLMVLTMGFFFNSIAIVPFSMLQAGGRPDLPCKFQAAELPIYVLLIFGLYSSFGILGVALAWLVRNTLDFFLLMYGVVKSGKIDMSSLVRHKVHAIILAFAGALLFAVRMPEWFEGLGFRGVVASGTALALFVLWLLCMSATERSLALSLGRKVFRLTR